jgi:gliding motility-associated-like protein
VNSTPYTIGGTYLVSNDGCTADQELVLTVTQTAEIIANYDPGLPINGSVGGISHYKILDNDTFDGVPITNPDLVNITYTTTNPGITLNDTDVVVAAGTPAGDYTLVYEICSKSTTYTCDTATVTVTVNNQIDAQNDTIENIDGTIGNTNAGNVLGNDTLNESNVAIGQVKLTIITTATSIGGAPVPDIDSIGQISIPPGTPAGPYTIVYQICDVINPTNCDDATVTIDVAVVLGVSCGAIVVHNAFSPNGDGKNATFVIDNIEDTTCYPENTVEIYNRWGVLVFETKNYNNTTNYFDGTSRGRTTISQSSGLPTGTYYYILNYTSDDGKTNKKDGYLYLTR